MDSMYQKIVELNSKVENLQEIVAQMSKQIVVLSSRQDEKYGSTVESSSSLNDMIPNPDTSNEYADLNMVHKDILVGGNSWQYNSYRYQQMGMSSDVQIRRLTAQLTAAYNRIAALEEQLLSKNHKEHKVNKQ
jgi:predicted  nucleic acid-binding Zn-ribbon protein